MQVRMPRRDTCGHLFMDEAMADRLNKFLSWSFQKTLGRFSLEPDRRVVGDQISVNEQDVLGLVDNVDVDKSQESGHLPAFLQGIQR